MGDEEESDYSGQSTIEGENSEEETTSALATVTTEALATDVNSTHTDGTSNEVEFILMVVIPLAALLILLSVVLIVTYSKSKRSKQVSASGHLRACGEPRLERKSVLAAGLRSHVLSEKLVGEVRKQGKNELGGETLKVPIFEEDTPSVMEIEMEELDKWMNSMNRNADYECLPTLKEEKEPNLSPSDSES
ncbi:Transmembrane protein 154 [Apodemus speciosus]|uniref:Transmembrane protein 154 n=1 Tax=Apodemus speciosus TaxID=105296 RepID=A0ABQ0EKT9_APOSI